MSDANNTTDTNAATTAATDADATANASDANADTGAATAAAGADDTSILGSATDADAGTGDGTGDGEAADAGGADNKAKADDKTDATVPETYELKVTAKDAEGKDVEVEIDTALLDEATPVLKDIGLTNEQANKLAPLVLKVEERVLQRQNDEFAVTRADWAKQVKADTEIGGANIKETERLAAKALDHFVGPAVTTDAEGNEVRNEFRQLLDETGLGNHPVMVRAFRNIGMAIAEDGTVARGNSTAATPKSREEILYGSNEKK